MWAERVVVNGKKTNCLSHTCHWLYMLIIDAKVLQAELVIAVRLDDVVSCLVEAVTGEEGRLEIALDAGRVQLFNVLFN